MRKLFLLIPVLFISLAVKAEVITIGPSNPSLYVGNILRTAVKNAAENDVIVVTDGIYNETGDYIYLSKNLEIRAAEGAHPVIEVATYLQVKNGKHVKISGLSFNGSAQDDSREQYFRFMDANENELELVNCTFTGIKKNVFRCESDKKFALLDIKNCTFTGCLSNVMKLESNLCGAAHFDGCEFSNTADIVIRGKSTSHLDECIVNDCYFHDNAKQSIYFEASATEGTETCDELTITNSTFANTTALSDWISVIDIRPNSATNTIKVTVDHCTFYNNPCVDSGHANIRTHDISDVAVSNSIFMHPMELAQRATYCDGGGSVSNCLAYNYTKDVSNYAHAYGPTVTNCAIADPLFTDAANDDYTFAGNWVTMSLSPARGAATDGSDLGDPRWYSAEVLPQVDFASPYQFVGAKAQIAGNIWYNSDDAYLYYNDKSECGTATWKIHATRACVLSATLNMNAGTTTGHKFKVEILDKDGNQVGETAEPSSKSDAGNIALPDNISIPAAGDYTVKLYNLTSWSSAKIDGVTFTYVGGEVQAMPGTTDINDAWFSSNGTRADGKITYSSISGGCWAKWNINVASAGTYNVTVNIQNVYGHNYVVEFLKEGESTPISIDEGGTTYGHDATLYPVEVGAVALEAGNYEMKVFNDVGDAALLSVTLSYAGGAAVDLSKTTPASLLPNADVILSDDWSIEGGKIVHPESKALTGWAKWNVNSADYGNYNVTVNISSDNGHLVRVEIFEDEAAAPIYTLDETSATQYHTGDQAIDLGNIILDNREYVVKVSNTGAYSHVQIASIVITYLNGARATLPASCIFADVMLSEKAHVTDGNLWFNTIGDSNPVGQWAKWNVKVSEAGTFLFTMNVSSTNSQTYKISILDGETVLDAFESSSLGTGDKTVKAYFNLAAGNYTVKLENTYSWSQGHIVSLVVTQPSLLVLDEAAETNAVISGNYRNGTHDIQIIRTIVAGMYNTICLPFDVDNAQLKAIFGSDVELKQMSSAELEGDVLNLIFDDVTTGIYRGTPYLIKTSKAVVNPVFADVEIKEKVGQATSGTNADFIGTLIKGEVPAGENNLFLGPNDKLYFSSSATPIQGMRAWFQIKGVSNPQNAIQHARIVTSGQVATEIELVGNEKTNGTVKTIENGQLIILKDGVRYNALGIRIK